MPTTLNETHAPERRSWVDSANEQASDFPIQNLPLGIFTRSGTPTRSAGIAIGDRILDLDAALDRDLLTGDAAEAARAARGGALNGLFARGQAALGALRRGAGALLDVGASGAAARAAAAHILLDRAACRMMSPTAPGSYTDFFAGIHHAVATGSLFAPDNPLPPNYKWVPIAYHGRASSVVASDAAVRRPLGQWHPAEPGAAPGFGPCRRLDFELEMGFFVGPGNAIGDRIAIGEAADQIMGFCLLNDWSARDVQRWEMIPLGPFLSKSFVTTVSPWVVTQEALAPFRVPAMARADSDPRPLSYLHDAGDAETGGLDVDLRVHLTTERMRDANEQPVTILASNGRYLYWTFAQMVAHHTVNGCNLEPGDLIGTGTISGPTQAQRGSLLELTRGGAQPLTLPNGEIRSFLDDGDTVTITGRCTRPGFVPIGFGACSGTVTPAIVAPA